MPGEAITPSVGGLRSCWESALLGGGHQEERLLDRDARGDFRQAAASSGPLFPHLAQRAVQIQIPQPRGRTQRPHWADKGGEAKRGKGTSWGYMALSQDLPSYRQSSPFHSALGIPAGRGFSKDGAAVAPLFRRGAKGQVQPLPPPPHRPLTPGLLAKGRGAKVPGKSQQHPPSQQCI